MLFQNGSEPLAKAQDPSKTLYHSKSQKAMRTFMSVVASQNDQWKRNSDILADKLPTSTANLAVSLLQMVFGCCIAMIHERLYQAGVGQWLGACPPQLSFIQQKITLRLG